jgi:signal peptidase I
MEKFGRVLLWTVIIVGAVAGLLRAFVLKVWTIPDDPVLAASIAPTLGGGDTVVVLTFGKGVFGDLVRCQDPEDPKKYVVGRISGVGGDVVETTGRDVIVNGTTYKGESSCPKPKYKVLHPTTDAEVDISCDVVQMGGGWHYRGYKANPFKPTDTKTEVSTGMVFLLSDNREFHDDSRDFGVLPQSSCNERIVFRLWGQEGWKDDERRMVYIH